MPRQVLTPKVKEAIRVDREEHGFTLGQIMERHGLRRSTAYRSIEGLDASKVKRAAPSRRVVQPIEAPPRPPISKGNLGEAARQILAGRMLQHGLDVYQPIGEDTPVDLVVLRPDGAALKCQCKTMFLTKTGCHFMPLQTVRKWGPNAKAVAHRYTPDEVDFFIGYAFEVAAAFVFPYAATAHLKHNVTAWLLRTPAGNNQHPRFDVTPYREAFHLLAEFHFQLLSKCL
ncbi:MAG: hypothetical protein JO257_35690 [Deltaproteobacteria bacterium]|nr:hypothetical protein [Deltaproteobacteria bacterium]